MAQISDRLCPQCGNTLAANQRFCNYCGARSEDAPEQETAAPVPLPPPLLNVAPQAPMSQQIPTISGTPAPTHMPSIAGTPSPTQQPAFHAPTAPPHVPHAALGTQHAADAATQHAAHATRHIAGSVAKRATHAGVRLLLKKPLVTAMVAVVLAGSGAGYAYYSYRSTAPTTFVIATDRGNNQIDRIDLATRNITVLLSNKVLPGTPDSVIFLSDTKVLINIITSGEIGIGDIQQDTYKSLGTGHGSSLRDMALRPDGSGVLIADTGGGNILEFHVDSEKITPFAQNLGGVQGLAFDAKGALYAAVGGQVIQLDPVSGKQLKTFALPGGSDGLAYDGRHNALDIASGGSIIALDLNTQKTTTLIDGIGTADGLAIDRQGNLFIADSMGVLELTTGNQLLIVGTDSNGITWDDVAPLSGAGAASY